MKKRERRDRKRNREKQIGRETIRKERNTQRKAEKEIETKRDRKIRKRKERQITS